MELDTKLNFLFLGGGIFLFILMLNQIPAEILSTISVGLLAILAVFFLSMQNKQVKEMERKFIRSIWKEYDNDLRDLLWEVKKELDKKNSEPNFEKIKENAEQISAISEQMSAYSPNMNDAIKLSFGGLFGAAILGLIQISTGNTWSYLVPDASVPLSPLLLANGSFVVGVYGLSKLMAIWFELSKRED